MRKRLGTSHGPRFRSTTGVWCLLKDLIHLHHRTAIPTISPDCPIRETDWLNCEWSRLGLHRKSRIGFSPPC